MAPKSSSETHLEFDITFHGPFRVATGNALMGVRVSVAISYPLPSSSLKGIMRAEAKRLFGAANPTFLSVFGRPGRGGTWAWGPVAFSGLPPMLTRTRVAIDQDTGAAAEHALVVGQELWPPALDLPTASFALQRRGFGESNVLEHAVLVSSAMSVKALGSDRRRGFGWVSIRCRRGLSEDVAEAMFEMAERSSPERRPEPPVSEVSK